MLKRWIPVFCLFAVFALVAEGSSTTHTIAGTLMRIDPGSIEVGTDIENTTSIALSSDTAYRKWIMAKPWQQDSAANAGLLRVGMRLRVEVANDNPMLAKTVWIVVR
jgi:hypothetical protein